MSTDDPRYRIKVATVLDRQLNIEWADGHVSQFHWIWLRHHCECKGCGTSLDGVRSIRIHHIAENVAPTELAYSGIEVNIVWIDDKHHSTYSARWLRNHCYSDAERATRKHRPMLWDGSIAQTLPGANFEEARANPEARLALLNSVCDYGFCKITHAPTYSSQSNQLIELVGPQRQTHFGTYNLARKKAVDNVGDTTDALDPHMDETYRMSHVGISHACL
ncbi:MAG: gamma-butyrobetaine dioxygenase [Parasphingorhabdus sp.]|jgi:gamma-butyrobetaine dioxygenase